MKIRTLIMEDNIIREQVFKTSYSTSIISGHRINLGEKLGCCKQNHKSCILKEKHFKNRLTMYYCVYNLFQSIYSVTTATLGEITMTGRAGSR